MFLTPKKGSLLKKKLLLIVLAFQTIYTTSASRENSQEDIELTKLMQHAENLECMGKFDQAETKYYEALEIRPDDCTIYFRLGCIYFKKQQWESAIEFYENTITTSDQANPSITCAAKTNIAVCLAHLGKRPEAIIQLEKIVSEIGCNRKVLIKLGLLLQQENQHEKALEYLRIALAVSPQDEQILFFIGESLRTLGKLDEATTAFVNAVKLNPNSLAALINAADTYAMQEKYEEALFFYKQIVYLRPDLKKAQLECVKIFKELGLDKQAMEMYEKVLRVCTNQQENLNFTKESPLEDLIDILMQMQITQEEEAKQGKKEQAWQQYDELRKMIQELETKQRASIMSNKELQQLASDLMQANRAIFEGKKERAKASEKIEKAYAIRRLIKRKIRELTA